MAIMTIRTRAMTIPTITGVIDFFSDFRVSGGGVSSDLEVGPPEADVVCTLSGVSDALLVVDTSVVAEGFVVLSPIELLAAVVPVVADP